ncbi:helix-turn-helix domain-containing protein [Gilvibacter sediminis]|uniref:helix-turn-helix domain-containing protein n=1 Tax=Gilvibacter sediminis TaxID=379071 RepID=UPI0023500EFB|nr:helix-turn-helix domain-containing protein [Gilvibacter sediminis]
MKVICLQDEAFYALVEEVVTRIKEKHDVKEDKWINTEKAMQLLNIRSKTTLQKLRDNQEIVFTQPQRKIILYDQESIIEYLERNVKS